MVLHRMVEPQRGWSSCLAVVFFVLFCVSPVARAQTSSLPNELYTKSPVAPGDRTLIRAFVDGELSRMAEGNPDQVLAARNRIAGVFDAMPVLQATVAFRRAFSEELAGGLTEALGTGSLLSDLNMLILAGRIETGAVGNVAAKGFESDNPAVRYRAAKAVFDVAKRDADRIDAEDRNLTQEDYRNLLTLLQGVVDREDNTFVLAQCLAATAQLPLPDADLEALRAVNRRVAFHVENPRQPMTGELEVIDIIFGKLIRQFAGQEGSEAQASARELAKVVLRFMKVVGAQLVEADSGGQAFSEARKDERILLLRKAEEILRWVATQVANYDVNQLPASINNAIIAEIYDEVGVRAEEWADRILTQPPLLIQSSELTVPEG